MVSIMESVWKQAVKTFGRKSVKSGPVFDENLTKLRSLANGITANDVNLNISLRKKEMEYAQRNRLPQPITYIDIYEDAYLTVGIFVVRPGGKLPLHDHPGMHGILKVLSGTLKIQTYSTMPTKPRKGSSDNMVVARKFEEMFLNSSNDACFLTPTERNLHEIHSIDGEAAFLDILAPPYSDSDDSDRACHYFAEVPGQSDPTLGDNCVFLKRIRLPTDFVCDTAKYEGPEIRGKN